MSKIERLFKAIGTVTDEILSGSRFKFTNGDITHIKLQLDQVSPEDLLTPDSNGITALQFAAQAGHLEAFKLILDKNPDGVTYVSTRNRTKGNTVLKYATSNIEIFKLIFNHPKFNASAINAIDYNGESLLHGVVRNGNVEALKLLLDHPQFDAIAFKIIPELTKDTLFHAAAYHESIELLELVNSKTPAEYINFKNCRKNLPVQIAIKAENLKVSKLLLDQTLLTVNDWSQILHSSIRSHEDIQVLIVEKAPLEAFNTAVNGFECIVLERATRIVSMKVCNMILSKTQLCTIDTENKIQIVKEAASRQFIDILKKLIEAINPVTDVNEAQALQLFPLAIKGGNEKFCEQLIPKIPDSQLVPNIQLSLQAGMSKVTKILIARHFPDPIEQSELSLVQEELNAGELHKIKQELAEFKKQADANEAKLKAELEAEKAEIKATQEQTAELQRVRQEFEEYKKQAEAERADLLAQIEVEKATNMTLTEKLNSGVKVDVTTDISDEEVVELNKFIEEYEKILENTTNLTGVNEFEINITDL